MKEIQKVKVSEHVSAIFQQKLPPKCGDPGMFTIPCVIGDITFQKAMLDLGASINIIPYSLYKSLKLGTLVETGVVIQLADRSNAYPKGIVEDVLVKVGELIFPADFYVLEMEHEKHVAPVLLGRPFMKTAKTKIDVDTGLLTMEFDGCQVEFNIYDSMKYLIEKFTCYSVDMMDDMTQDLFNIENDDKLRVVIENDLDKMNKEYVMSTEIEEVMRDLNENELNGSFKNRPILLTIPNEKNLPSVLQETKPELKQLLDHLKYVFLGENKTLPVIISNKLNDEQGKKLIVVLKVHKDAIGWTIADIKGISPTTCMHKILLEEGARPVRQPQRRLNPPMMKVVKTKILKLLQAGIIFPISHSE